MYRKIVVGHDLHDGGRDALALGRRLAEIAGAQLVLAGIFPFGVLPRGFEPRWREEEERVAAELERAALETGAQAEAFPSSSPSRGLHDLAEETDADLLVVGSSRHAPVGQLLVGNVGLALLHGAPCGVAVAPSGHRERPGELEAIIVGVDGSPEADLALEQAVSLARAGGARLELVAVAEPPHGVTELDEHAGLGDAVEREMREVLELAAATVPEGVRCETGVVRGEPAACLAAAAEAEGRLLMLGSRGYGPVRRVLLGSVSAQLVRRAPCPVVVHPRGA